MIRLLWLFLAVAAIAIAAAYLAGLEGEVVLSWGTWEYRASPALAAGVAVCVGGILFLLWRLAGLLLDWPGALSSWRRNRRRRATYLALAHGMVAVAAGDAKAARRHEARARSGDEPLLGQLLAAQTAQLEGDEARAAKAFADMLGRPETEFLGLRGLVMQALRRGDMEAARRHAARAFALRPRTPWVAAALFELETQAGDWPRAGKVLEAQARMKLLPPDLVKRRRAVLAAATAKNLKDAGAVDAALVSARAALKITPGLVPAALIAADAWLRNGRLRRASGAIETAWETNPHPDLAAAYAALHAGTPNRGPQRLIALNPSHPESVLLDASEAIAEGRPDTAERLLATLADRRSARACRLMADIAAARGDTAAARLWSDRAMRAPRDGLWRCTGCGHQAEAWSATCTSCGAFDTLAWVAVGTEPVSTLPDGGADRVLYRLPAPHPDPARPAPRG